MSMSSGTYKTWVGTLPCTVKAVNRQSAVAQATWLERHHGKSLLSLLRKGNKAEANEFCQQYGVTLV